jgi:hypothetical protein
LESLLQELRAALTSQDNGRALYLLVKEIGGDPLSQELPICNPDTDRPIGYLVPTRQRYALNTAAEIRGMRKDAGALERDGGHSGEWGR